MNAQKRDANEREIIDAFQRAGCFVKQMDKKDGFDLLVANWRGVFIVEVKNPFTKWKLTESENKMRNQVRLCGGDYHIIETVDGAMKMLNL